MKHRIRDITIIVVVFTAIVAAAWYFAEITVGDHQEIGQVRAYKAVAGKDKNGHYYSPTGQRMPFGYTPGRLMYTCRYCMRSFEFPEELESHKCPKDMGEAYWSEKDENGVSRGERMAERNKQYREAEEENKRKRLEASIEREARIRARSAQILIELIKGESK
jgi:hypothetical protein